MLKLIPAGTEEMFRMIDCNEVDAIMTLDSHIYNTDYMLAKEEKSEAIFVAAPQMAKKIMTECGKIGDGEEEAAVSIYQLRAYPFLLTERGMSYRRLLDEKLAAQSLEIKPILEIGNADLLADLAEQGAGITVLPDFIVRERILQGRLVRLQVKEMELEIWKQMIYHRKKWMSKPLDCVIRHFCE